MIFLVALLHAAARRKQPMLPPPASSTSAPAAGIRRQFAQGGADLLGRRQQKDIIAMFDDGVALGNDRMPAAEDGRNACLDADRQMVAHRADPLADQQAPDRRARRPAIRAIGNSSTCSASGNSTSSDVVGDDFLGQSAKSTAKFFCREQRLAVEKSAERKRAMRVGRLNRLLATLRRRRGWSGRSASPRSADRRRRRRHPSTEGQAALPATRYAHVERSCRDGTGGPHRHRRW